MSLSVTVRVMVRFSEVDPIGTVWHGNYVRFLEDAREEFGRKFGLEYMTIFNNGYFAPVYDLNLRFRQMCGVDDVLLVTCTYRYEKGARICFDYQVAKENDGSLVLEGSSVQLFTTHDGLFEPSAPDFYREWQDRHGVIPPEKKHN